MKTRKLVYPVMQKAFLFAIFMFAAAHGFSQANFEMNELFGMVESQLTDSVPTISKILYIVGGICFLIGGLHIAVKLYQGNSNVAKELGIYLGAMAFFCLVGYICDKLMTV